MRTFKDIITTKAFYASYGRVMQVKSNEEARECLLMLKETGGIQVDVEDIFHRMRMFEKENKKYITHLCTNTVDGDVQICLIVDTDSDKNPKNLDDDYGIFCFVYNYTVPEFSQYGYCFFEEASPTYRRVG